MLAFRIKHFNIQKIIYFSCLYSLFFLSSWCSKFPSDPFLPVEHVQCRYTGNKFLIFLWSWTLSSFFPQSILNLLRFYDFLLSISTDWFFSLRLIICYWSNPVNFKILFIVFFNSSQHFLSNFLWLWLVIVTTAQTS